MTSDLRGHPDDRKPRETTEKLADRLHREAVDAAYQKYRAGLRKERLIEKAIRDA